ncbi:MAG: cell wall hydrolase [Butyrivibrio sp.]|nr:cell wall hydrolase [Butyrivibrio sp.]
MRKRFILGVLLAALMAGELSFNSGAAPNDTITKMQQQEAQTKQAISDLEKQTKETKAAITALEGQKEKTQANVDNLEGQSSLLQETINGYSNQLSSLNEEISDAEYAMAEVSSQIVELNNELFEAQQREKARYELLKKRMKVTYESGGTSGLMRLLLESGSFSELFTKFEYLNAIVKYDREKISEYKKLQADIEARKTVVEQKESELDKYQSELDEKHDELSVLKASVKGQLDETNSSLFSERGKLEDYDKQLASLDQKMKNLESQTAAAQAQLAKQIAERLALVKEDTSGSYAATGTELEWLAATIQAEAGGESYTGKLAVGSVIMNRVKSSQFPNTVIGVITQNMQFASYRSGKVELIMSNGANSTCVQAAQEVLDGARVGDYLFFMTKYYADYYGIAEYTMIGNHAFFYNWVVKKKVEEPVEEENAENTENTSDTSKKSSDKTQKTEETEPAPAEEQEPEFTPEQLEMLQQLLEQQQSGEAAEEALPQETP